jgi:hypothetical protein
MLAVAVLAASCSSAFADAIYTYTGNAFTTNAQAWVSGVGPQVPQLPFTTSDSLTVSLTFAAPLASNQEISGSLGNVGAQIWDGVDSVDIIADDAAGYEPQFAVFDLSISATGAIANWQIEVINAIDLQTPQDGGLDFWSCNQGSETLLNQCGPDVLDEATHGQGSLLVSGLNLSSPGTWSETTSGPATPEPATGIMAILGALVLLRRRHDF